MRIGNMMGRPVTLGGTETITIPPHEIALTMVIMQRDPVPLGTVCGMNVFCYEDYKFVNTSDTSDLDLIVPVSKVPLYHNDRDSVLTINTTLPRERNLPVVTSMIRQTGVRDMGRRPDIPFFHYSMIINATGRVLNTVIGPIQNDNAWCNVEVDKTSTREFINGIPTYASSSIDRLIISQQLDKSLARHHVAIVVTPAVALKLMTGSECALPPHAIAIVPDIFSPAIVSDSSGRTANLIQNFIVVAPPRMEAPRIPPVRVRRVHAGNLLGDELYEVTTDEPPPGAPLPDAPPLPPMSYAAAVTKKP